MSRIFHHFVAAAMWYTRQRPSTLICKTAAICGGSSFLVNSTSTPMMWGYEPQALLLILEIISSALSGSLVQTTSSVSLPWSATPRASDQEHERRRGCRSSRTSSHNDAWQTLPPPLPSSCDCGLRREMFVGCLQKRWKRQWKFSE